MYLLDTNHCSAILEKAPALLRKMHGVSGQLVVTCEIVRGELVFMAMRSERPAETFKV